MRSGRRHRRVATVLILMVLVPACRVPADEPPATNADAVIEADRPSTAPTNPSDRRAQALPGQRRDGRVADGSPTADRSAGRSTGADGRDRGRPGSDIPDPEGADRDSSDPRSAESSSQDADRADPYPIDVPVPDSSVIDEIYVQRVLEQLERNYHQLVLSVRGVGVDDVDDLDPVAYAHLLPVQAVTAVQPLEHRMVETILLFESESWLEDDPQPAGVRVEELMTVSTDCIAATVHLEADDLYTVPLTGRWHVGIRPRDVAVSRAGTIWRFAARVPDRGEPLDVCV